MCPVGEVSKLLARPRRQRLLRGAQRDQPGRVVRENKKTSDLLVDRRVLIRVITRDVRRGTARLSTHLGNRFTLCLGGDQLPRKPKRAGTDGHHP